MVSKETVTVTVLVIKRKRISLCPLSATKTNLQWHVYLEIIERCQEFLKTCAISLPTQFILFIEICLIFIKYFEFYIKILYNLDYRTDGSLH